MTIRISRRIRIEDWPAERDRLGLVVRRVRVNQDPLEVTLVIEAAGGEPIEFFDEDTGDTEPMTAKKRKPGPGLAVILADMHAQALARQGETQTTRLGSGLRVDMNVGIDGQTRILLARQGVFPSNAEFNTTLAHFGKGVGYDPPLDIAPAQFTHNGWYCLRAAWPTP